MLGHDSSPGPRTHRCWISDRLSRQTLCNSHAGNGTGSCLGCSYTAGRRRHLRFPHTHRCLGLNTEKHQPQLSQGSARGHGGLARGTDAAEGRFLSSYSPGQEIHTSLGDGNPAMGLWEPSPRLLHWTLEPRDGCYLQQPLLQQSPPTDPRPLKDAACVHL